MKATFGVVESKKGKIAMFLIAAIFISFLIFSAFDKNWGILIPCVMNLIILSVMIYQRSTRFIQITDHGRLLFGAFQIDIRSIDRIEFVDDNMIRIHYTFQEQSRKSQKIRLKENEKDSFFDILRQINPQIEIH